MDLVTYKVPLRKSPVQLITSHFMDLGGLDGVCIFFRVGKVGGTRLFEFGHCGRLEVL